MTDLKKYTVTSAQMRLAEEECERRGVSCAALMRNAGAAAAEVITQSGRVKTAVILTGGGNNGGDGFALAHGLKEKGVLTAVIMVCLPKTDLARDCYWQYKDDIDECVSYAEDKEAAFSLIKRADVIADCVYGTGFHGELKEELRELFSACGNSSAVRYALDIPSGCSASDGSADKCSFKADVTLALGAVKTGHLHIPCSSFWGDIKLLDIGIDAPCYKEYEAVICDDTLISCLKKRERITHKGSFGRLLCVAGGENCIGAAYMAVNAALKTGTGIVELASVREVTQAVAVNLHECVLLPLSSGKMTADSADKLCKAAKGASAIVFGCGMGNSEDTYLLFKALLQSTDCPILLDADGINSLVLHIDDLKDNGGRLILTPHIKEFSRISGIDTDVILKDKLKAAREFAARFGVHLLLKDAYSVYASPCGFTAVNMSGNAALAKGGSGDTLSGTIGGLLAQGVNIGDACMTGAYLFGSSAEYAAQSRSMSGIMPSELPALYPYLLKERFGVK